MICEHLQELFDVCREHDLKMGGADLIRIVCGQCGQQEVCPSTLVAPPDQIAGCDSGSPARIGEPPRITT
jgi:hypothetical protein